MPTDELTGADVRRVRLVAQGLVPGPDAPVDGPAAVRRSMCVQSQELAQSWWSVRMRSAAAESAAELRAAYDAGDMVRTHVLRPTWHTLDPADLRWLQELTGPRVAAPLTGMHRRMGVSETDQTTARAVVAEQVSGGAARTRAELAHALTAAGLDVGNGIVLANLIMQSEIEAVICSGPMRGRQTTYVAVDTRCPPDAPRPDEPAVELLRRCVAGHGPISLRDVSRWSGLTLTQVRQAARVADDLVMITVDGVELAHDPTATAAALTGGPPAPRVMLLPLFDELTLSYRDVPWPWPGAAPTSVPTVMVNRSPGLIMVGDELVGYWARSLTDQRLEVDTWIAPDARSVVDPDDLADVAVAMAEFYAVELVHTPAA